MSNFNHYGFNRKIFIRETTGSGNLNRFVSNDITEKICLGKVGDAHINFETESEKKV